MTNKQRMWYWFRNQADHDKAHTVLYLQKYETTQDPYYLEVSESFLRGYLADLEQLKRLEETNG